MFSKYNAIDLIFIFRSISIGIICGAGFPSVAVIESIILSAAYLLFNMVPLNSVRKLMLVNIGEVEKLQTIIEIVNNNTKNYEIKSQTLRNNNIDIIFEIRLDNEMKLMNEIKKIEGVKRCTILNHEGEVTY